MDPSVVRSEALKVSRSEIFRRSTRLKRFLAFIVEKTLDEKVEDLNEYSIATEVYGRPANFDPVCDNIVRSEAHRLRKKLDEYYQANSNDLIRITLPKGAYVAEFSQEPRNGSRLALRFWKLAAKPEALGAILLAVLYTAALRSAGSNSTVALATSEPAPYERLGVERRHPAAGLHEAQKFDAYSAYIEGREKAHQYLLYFDPPVSQEARHLLSRATELDPEMTEAYVELANIQLWSLYPPPSTAEREALLRDADRVLHRALQLDPSNSAALALMGRLELERGNPIAGARLAERAAKAGLEDAIVARSLAWIYSSLGFYEAALELQRIGRQADPEALTFVSSDVWLRAHAGKIDEATETIESFRRQYPDIWLYSQTLAEIHLWARRYPQARQSASDAARIRGGREPLEEAPTLAALYAAGAAGDGDLGPARGVVAKFSDRAPMVNDAFLVCFAYVMEPGATADQIRRHPRRGNYRWLIGAPLPSRFTSSPEYRSLAGELYAEWRHKLAILGGQLPVQPPELPPPPGR